MSHPSHFWGQIPNKSADLSERRAGEIDALGLSTHPLYPLISKGFALCRQPLWIDCRLSRYMFGWLGGLHDHSATYTAAQLVNSWIWERI